MSIIVCTMPQCQSTAGCVCGEGWKGRRQSNREVAELIAKFRMPPGFNWTPLADDIETALNVRSGGGDD